MLRSRKRRRHVLLLLAAATVGLEEKAHPGPTVTDPAPEMQMREVRTGDWLRQVQETLSSRYQVDPSELRFSAPPPKLAAFVRGPAPPSTIKGSKKRPPHPTRPRRHDIVVVDVLGQKKGQFPAITARGSDEPPRDLRFLRDDRLVYEAPTAATPAQVRKQKKPRGTVKHRAHDAAEPAPARLFVIQPIGRRARPIRCEGSGFQFTPHRDHLVFVGGTRDRTFVAVDGIQVYPRKKRSRTTIVGDPVWSKDGSGLAFLESPKNKPARLVLLGAYDNPREDTGWDLPAGADLEGARVFWIRPGKLAVGKAPTHAIFTASFAHQNAGAADTFDPGP